MSASISTALMGAGAASQTIGAYYSAKNQKSTLGFQAATDDQNARLAELSAQTELLRGQREQQNSQLTTAQLKSRQRVSMAANGVDLGEGTAANVLTTTDVMGEIDANTLVANAVRSAWGYRTQASTLRSDARVKRATAGAISPGAAAFSTLLGQAGKVATNWYDLSKNSSTTTAPTTSDKRAGGLNPAKAGYGLRRI